MSPETDRNSEFGASHHRPGISSLSARIDPPGRGHKARKRQPKVQKLTRDGVPYPSLPALVVKKLAASLARSCGSSKAKINKASLGAIMQASDWFFEQIGVDLKAYADHANKKTIDETDVITLMKRLPSLANTPSHQTHTNSEEQATSIGAHYNTILLSAEILIQGVVARGTYGVTC